MTKKRFLIAIAIVMVLILSVAVFVACNENQTKSYTVKFVDGESEVKSVSVEEGKTIADADVPADLTKDGYVFEGWYVGDVAFDKSAAITADVTYSAKWTKLHTVKFVDGNETIKTATVKDGEKLKDADVPADLTATGKAFEGWFDGTTAFDKDATITADKTFAAKWVGLFNVTFKNGEETIKVAQVKDGEKIADADIPEDLTAATEEFAFAGWFDGETEFDADAAVTANVVYTAKWNKVAYVVKFVDGETVAKTIYVEISADAKLTADDVAVDYDAEEGSFVLGWYAGEVKAAADVAISADTTFSAFVVNVASYVGGYSNADKTAFVTITEQNASIGSLQTKAFTFDATTEGAIVVKGDGYEKYTMLLQKDGNLYVDHYYDSCGDGFINDAEHEYFTFTKLAATGFAGKYRADNNEYFELTDSGIMTKYKGSSVLYGVIFEGEDEGTYTLKYKTDRYSAEILLTVTVDANGNIVTGKGIYVKGSKSIVWAEGKYQEEYQNVYIHTLDDGSSVCVLKDTDGTFSIATLTGTVADGEIVTVTAGEKSYTFKLKKSSYGSNRFSFSYPAAEVGTYTGADGEIVLDGYGMATVGGQSKAYVISGDLVSIDGRATIKIDTTAKTYVAADVIGLAGSYIYYFNYAYSSSYTLKLDGCGIAVCTSNGSTYVGKYTVADGKIVITGASTANGTYTTFDTEKGFIRSSYDGDKVWYNDKYAAERADVDYSKFVGYFANGDKAIEISKFGSYYLLEGFASTAQRINTSDEWGFNWDGTVLLYNYDDPCSFYKNQKTDYFFSINAAGNLVVSHMCKEDDGDGGYNLVKRTVVYTKTTKPVTFADAFVGTWYTSTDTVVITKTTITVNDVLATDLAYDGATYTYTFKINGVEYKAVDNVYSMNFGKADAETLETLLATKPVAATIDDFVGSYTGSYSGTTIATTVESIDKATLSIDGTSIDVTTIELGFDYIAFTTADETYKIKREADGSSYNYYFNDSADSLGYWGMGIQLDRTVKENLDAFAGTWEKGSDTIVFDGKGSGNQGAYTFSYTVGTNGKATFSYGSRDWTAELSSDGNTITVSYYDDDAMVDVTVKYTKVQETVSFVGTWVNESTTDNYYGYVLEFTEDGMLKVTSTKYPADSAAGQWYNGEKAYTIDGNVATVSGLLGYDWTITLNADNTIVIGQIDSDNYTGPLNNVKFTKQA